MVLGKVYRVWHKVDSVYSVLLEKRNDKSQSLLFESEVISTLSESETEAIKSQYSFLEDAYGCLGVLELPLGDSSHVLYLVLVKSCVSIGKIDRSEIFRITDTEFISLRNNSSDDDKVQEIRKILNSGSFYFSWTSVDNEKPLDLTLCAQRKLRTDETDNRFFWNRTFFLNFIQFGVDTNRWLLKALCGGVAISTVYVGSHQARACLISRLSSERAGTRFNVRGVDDDGNVANFVETEQLIHLDDKVSSYILLRGSVPLFWEQPGINVGSHKMKMSRGTEVSQPAYDRHVATVRKRYGKTTFINLMGCKEGEAMLTKMYKSHHKASCLTKDVPLIHFDYHSECPRGKQENLEKKFAYEIKNYLKEFSFFSYGENVEQNTQVGCFRINCVDCLDRTNNVQKFIGLNILKKQLVSLNLADKPNIVSRFEETFKNMWISNGDQISRIYAGTGALEGKSMIKDSTLTVARTIQNNLLDSSKQEAFDILLYGKSLSHDYSAKARSLLPPSYLHLPNSILIPMCDRYLEYTEPLLMKITVGTWNVNGGKHFTNIVYRQSDPLSDWLLDYKTKKQSTLNIMDLSPNDSLGGFSSEKNPVDIYAIGFEEIVDLNASNIVAASTSNQREWLVELQKTISRDTEYVLIACEQLVGVCLFVFIRPQHAPFVRDVAVDTVKTGLGGATGNKGGVAIRMLFYNTSVCFVCAHFAAGQSQVQDRNADYAEITRKLNFPSGRTLNSHDLIFWCGDFNYRIDLETDRVKECAKNRDWDILLANEQLKVQQAKGKVFRNYVEGPINFAPTYKYDMESDDYDTSEKCRIPAYTDRVLFKKRFRTRTNEDPENLDYGKIVFYGRCELKTSDHRPVIGEYDVDILKVKEKYREDVFKSILQDCGPLDACILVKHKNGITALTEDLVTSILKLLADEGGEVIQVRLGDSHLAIHFRESVNALKVYKKSSISNIDSGLFIELKNPNWVETIRAEMKLGTNNTIPLCESSSLSLNSELDAILINEPNKLKFRSNVLCVENNLNTIATPLHITPSPTFLELSEAEVLANMKTHSSASQPPTIGSKNGPPPKPPPPIAGNTQSATKPLRPAPPPPRPIDGGSIHRGSSFESEPFKDLNDPDSSYSMPPPAIPAPCPPQEPSSLEPESIPCLTARPKVPTRPQTNPSYAPPSCPPPIPARTRVTAGNSSVPSITSNTSAGESHSQPPIIPPRRTQQ